MIRISEIRSDHELNTEELYRKASKILKVNKGALRDLRIIKRSLDKRHKGQILHIYTVILSSDSEEKLVKRSGSRNVSLYEEKHYSIPKLNDNDLHRVKQPVIVGFGPAGMFASLYLTLCGLKPLIIERGEDVDRRDEKVKAFWESGILDTESNVQFGEGGAGTFSDGKLQTGVRDSENRNGFVLKTFVKYGAPEHILYDSKPHIGSDILKNVVRNLREDIISHGAEVRFSTRFTGFKKNTDGVLEGIYVNDTEFIPCDACILSIGHSARDTFELLNKSGLKMEPKSFAVGVRVEHRQEDIDRAMYGEGYEGGLPAADYKLTYHASDNRGVYSFCMCPGGYVVNSSSEDNKLCTNGMSYSGRSGENANSAIVVTVTPDDYDNAGFSGFGVLSGMEFMRDLEKKAFNECAGDIPCQRFIDFKEGRISVSFDRVKPECKGRYGFGNLRNIFPDYISEDIIEAMESFGRKIDSFDSSDAVLSGVESRTSSPVRIIRNECFLSSVPGIIPSGEGAGYAGGIMSAAIDGLKCAEAVVKYAGLFKS